ncbi:MAG TPA: MFS transporter [Phenylobacterium sp.]|nr:MFS transporter [Phenylobacterium sp.]
MDLAADRPIAAQPRAAERYAIGLLFLIYTSSFLDRQVLNILAEPIKTELRLADWQVGLLAGLAFSLFYAVLGLPLGRFADRPATHRPRLIAVCFSVWSVMTMLCALPVNFVQLALARVGVGVGEAGCTPAAHSLISDLVPSERRAGAMGVYSLAIPVGKLLGLALGGWIAHQFGWRAAFLLVGAPGLALAGLAWLTLPEPRRARASAPSHAAASWRVFLEVARIRTFWMTALAGAFMSFLSLGEAAFMSSFLIRVHHFTVAQAGLALGLVLGLGGALGSWAGGTAADRLGRRDARAYLLLPAVAALAGGSLLVAALYLPQAGIVLGLVALAAALTSSWYGPSYAVIQGLVAPEHRATASATNLLIANLLGLGLGPVVVGALSDLFNHGASLGGWTLMPLGPAEGLRAALIASTGAVVIACGCFGAGAASIRRELRS